jgi:hypothetical protein
MFEGIFSVVGSFLKLDSFVQVSIGTAAVSSVLLHQQIPKVGPGRAIVLALRSFVRSGPAFPSMRSGDKGNLLSKLNSLAQDQFIVCKGPRGIGKTHMIRDALTRTCGVVSLDIAAGTAEDDILNRAHAAIANIKVGAMLVNPELDSLRVLWWYRLLFRQSPIVVISAMERTADHIKAGVRLAAVPGAARKLASAGFRVIVDASENSIATESTEREQILRLAPLPFEVLLDCCIFVEFCAHIHAVLSLLL